MGAEALGNAVGGGSPSTAKPLPTPSKVRFDHPMFENTFIFVVYFFQSNLVCSGIWLLFDGSGRPASCSWLKPMGNSSLAIAVVGS